MKNYYWQSTNWMVNEVYKLDIESMAEAKAFLLSGGLKKAHHPPDDGDFIAYCEPEAIREEQYKSKAFDYPVGHVIDLDMCEDVVTLRRGAFIGEQFYDIEIPYWWVNNLKPNVFADLSKGAPRLCYVIADKGSLSFDPDIKLYTDIKTASTEYEQLEEAKRENMDVIRVIWHGGVIAKTLGVVKKDPPYSYEIEGYIMRGQGLKEMMESFNE